LECFSFFSPPPLSCWTRSARGGSPLSPFSAFFGDPPEPLLLPPKVHTISFLFSFFFFCPCGNHISGWLFLVIQRVTLARPSFFFCSSFLGHSSTSTTKYRPPPLLLPSLAMCCLPFLKGFRRRSSERLSSTRPTVWLATRSSRPIGLDLPSPSFLYDPRRIPSFSLHKRLTVADHIFP